MVLSGISHEKTITVHGGFDGFFLFVTITKLWHNHYLYHLSVDNWREPIILCTLFYLDLATLMKRFYVINE